MLTLGQALDELSSLTASGGITKQKLLDLVDRVSLDVAPGQAPQGSVTLLYSGSINGVSSSEYVKRMVSDGDLPPSAVPNNG